MVMSGAGMPSEAQEILNDLGHEYSDRAAAEVMRRYDRTLTALADEGAIISTLPAAEKQRWIDGLPNLARDWVRRLEARELPAGRVLHGLMERLRAAGIEPVRHWDRDLRE